MDKLKTWLIEVAVKKMGPSMVRAALGALVAGLIAHAEVLAKIGVVYDAATNTILIHLTTAGVWLGTIGFGTIVALLMGLQHHVEAAVTGEPHSGDPALEARRATDTPSKGDTDAK